MLRLDAMLDEGGADNRTQLNAIQTVLKMNQVDGTVENQNDDSVNYIHEIRKLGRLQDEIRAANIKVTGLPGENGRAKAVPPDIRFIK